MQACEEASQQSLMYAGQPLTTAFYVESNNEVHSSFKVQMNVVEAPKMWHYSRFQWSWKDFISYRHSSRTFCTLWTLILIRKN